MVVRSMIMYASLAWSSKTKPISAMNNPSNVQRLACLGITGELKKTPTQAMEMLLELPRLHMVLKGEARMSNYRLENSRDYRRSVKINITG